MQKKAPQKTKMNPNPLNQPAGILLVDKPRGKTAFSLVGALRRILKVRKIGHAGTLDPFATGVMVMLIGSAYTRLSDNFLGCDKEYIAKVRLGISTDTYDCDGQIKNTSDLIPSLEQIHTAIEKFQGEIDQIPPMFSAKKQNGKKLYELARQGKTVDRPAVKVKVNVRILDYNYPYLNISVACSKGTYIRSIANDLGELLGCGAHLECLQRTRSGTFNIEECLDGALLFSSSPDEKYISTMLRR
jgi:tRNA pseudouridine55 synthase